MLQADLNEIAVETGVHLTALLERKELLSGQNDTYNAMIQVRLSSIYTVFVQSSRCCRSMLTRVLWPLIHTGPGHRRPEDAIFVFACQRAEHFTQALDTAYKQQLKDARKQCIVGIYGDDILEVLGWRCKQQTEQPARQSGATEQPEDQRREEFGRHR